MKYVTTILLSLIVSSNAALAADKFGVDGNVNLSEGSLNSNLGLSYGNRKKVKATGAFSTNGSSHAGGAKVQYLYKSKSGKTKVEAGVGMSDFNSRNSFSTGVGFSMKF